MRNEFTAIIEQGEDGWVIAYCSEIPEANGQGRTEEDALENLREGILLALEMRREEALQGVSPDAVREILVGE